MKKLVSIVLIALLLICIGSCDIYLDMPFNGDIEFHDIGMTIPSDFIRDSAQSNENVWFFEKDGYKESIIITHTKVTASTDFILDDYIDYMRGNGAMSERTKFREDDAVYTTYTKNDMFTREILFVYKGASYAIALRGGTEDSFKNLTVSIKFR